MQADLRNADLRGADLRRKNLRGAILDGAVMDRHTSLRGTDLSGASMLGTYLSHTDLRFVNLRGVHADGVVFSRMDFSHVEFSIARKVLKAYDLIAVYTFFLIINLAMLCFEDRIGDAWPKLMFAFVLTGVFSCIIVTCRSLPSMNHALRLMDVSRYMRIAEGNEIEIDRLSVLISLFKTPVKKHINYRPFVMYEINYYIKKGYFPENCYDAKRDTVCFSQHDDGTISRTTE